MGATGEPFHPQGCAQKVSSEEACVGAVKVLRVCLCLTSAGLGRELHRLLLLLRERSRAMRPEGQRRPGCERPHLALLGKAHGCSPAPAPTELGSVELW